jgi:hypothetical protein
MADLAILTSLYRSDRFLPGHLRRLRVTARRLREAGLAVEVVAVANDASPRERHLLARLVATAAFPVTVRHVPRETLYASWNRAIAATTAPVLAPWNVDDIRTPESLKEGCERLGGDLGLVYFPFMYARAVRLLGFWPSARLWIRYAGHVTPFVDAQTFQEQACFGPFIMFTRRLYEATGPFDEWFRIWGDLDWVLRAARHADFCLATSHGGTFRLHGDNLGWPADPEKRQVRVAELNVLALEHGSWHTLGAADPQVMRALWEDRGSRVQLTPALERLLWGPDARARWEAALRARREASAVPPTGPRRIADALRWRWRVLRFAARSSLRPGGVGQTARR